MKILQTPARFYPYTGGVENYVRCLGRELVGFGHDVTVLCANEPKSKEVEFIDGMRVRRLPYVGKIANTNITLRLPVEIAREEFDLVHTHLPTPWSADWSCFASVLRGRPLVLTYYNDIVGDGFAGELAAIYNRTNLKILLRRTSKIIVIGPEYANFSRHLKGFEDKIEAIPVGVDLERFVPDGTATDGRTLSFLSVLDRYHRYKGLEDLLFALVKVKRDVPRVKLIVGGGGELLDHYRRLSRQLHLEDHVEFLGFLPEEMLAKYYNRSDIFILPSTSSSQEGFGMVLLEAMACEKPVICTEVAGVAGDVRERGAGLVVEPSNQDELARAISRLLQNGSVARKMGEAGRKLAAEKYGWREVARRVEEVYDGLV